MDSVRSTSDLPTRNIDFDPLFTGLPRHLAAGGDLVTSHVIAVLSAVFPDGESFFIHSVRAVRNQIVDPALLERIHGFVGQEARHGREHRDLNAHLATLGYPTKAIERYVKAVVTACARLFSDETNLAVTAGLEHYTAILAEQLLGDAAARDQIGDEGVRSLFLWHAVEESEHKAVAFDTYRAIGGSERRRILAMYFINLCFFAEASVWTAVSFLEDPEVTRHPTRAFRSLWQMRRSPFLSRGALASILDYNRRGFHPEDHDTTDLIEHWRSELFGPHGTLAEPPSP